MSIYGFWCLRGVLEPIHLPILRDDYTQEQGRHGAPCQLKCPNLKQKLSVSAKRKGICSAKNQLSRKVSRRNGSGQGRKAHRSPSWARAQSGANGDAGFLLTRDPLQQQCPVSHCSRALSPPPCALQVSGWVEEVGETKWLHRATSLFASAAPSSQIALELSCVLGRRVKGPRLVE